MLKNLCLLFLLDFVPLGMRGTDFVFRLQLPPLCSMGFFCAPGGVTTLTTVSDLPLNFLHSNPFHFKIVDSLQNRSSLLCGLEMRCQQLRVEGLVHSPPLAPHSSLCFAPWVGEGWGRGRKEEAGPPLDGPTVWWHPPSVATSPEAALQVLSCSGVRSFQV